MPSRPALLPMLVLVLACGSDRAEEADAPEPQTPVAAGAGSAAADTAGSAAAYRALGTEPFWALDVTAEGLRFSTPDDTAGSRTPPLRPARAGDTLIWHGATERAMLDVRIWPERCSDGMSDRTWTHRAVVQVDTSTYRGCADPAPGLGAGRGPRGDWTVVGHRMPGVSAMSATEAGARHGDVVTYGEHQARSGSDACRDVRYRYSTAPADSVLGSYNTTAAALDMSTAAGGFIGVTEVRCGDDRWPTLGGVLLWESDDGAVLAPWDGVFFELRRADG